MIKIYLARSFYKAKFTVNNIPKDILSFSVGLPFSTGTPGASFNSSLSWVNDGVVSSSEEFIWEVSSSGTEFMRRSNLWSYKIYLDIKIDAQDIKKDSMV